MVLPPLMASRTSIQVSSSVHTLSSAAIGRGAFISASRRLAASACCSGVIGGRCGRAPGSCARHADGQQTAHHGQSNQTLHNRRHSCATSYSPQVREHEGTKKSTKDARRTIFDRAGRAGAHQLIGRNETPITRVSEANPADTIKICLFVRPSCLLFVSFVFPCSWSAYGKGGTGRQSLPARRPLTKFHCTPAPGPPAPATMSQPSQFPLPV